MKCIQKRVHTGGGHTHQPLYALGFFRVVTPQGDQDWRRDSGEPRTATGMILLLVLCFPPCLPCSPLPSSGPLGSPGGFSMSIVDKYGAHRCLRGGLPPGLRNLFSFPFPGGVGARTSDKGDNAGSIEGTDGDIFKSPGGTSTLALEFRSPVGTSMPKGALAGGATLAICTSSSLPVFCGRAEIHELLDAMSKGDEGEGGFLKENVFGVCLEIEK